VKIIADIIGINRKAEMNKKICSVELVTRKSKDPKILETKKEEI
jgi:hypothetical protein